MKIIGIKNNYASANKASLKDNAFPDVFFMADSSIIKTNNPFFLPDFASEFSFHTALVFRTSRLGKSIPLKFAHRYVDAVTVGFAVSAQNPTSLPSDSPLLHAFDGAAMLGDFISIDASQPLTGLTVTSAVNGNEVCSITPAGMIHDICEIVHTLSSVCTIKIGDLIFACFGEQQPNPIKIGDTLTAQINGEEKLRIRIK